MASTLFSGTSRYSSDFSSVVERTVAIASLPIKLLQQQKDKLDLQVTALTSLNTQAGKLQNSIKALETAFGSSSFSAASSNTSALGATATEAASEGSWDVTVDNLGSATAFVISGFPAVSDPSSDAYISGSVQTVIVDGELITLHPAGQTLRGLVDEINKSASAKARASIVNVGTSSTPQYQLSLQSTKLGALDITFNDDAATSTNTALQRGAQAEYKVNGTTIVTDSRTVTLAPGVTLDLKQTSTAAATVTVSRSSSALSGALSGFISAFNGANGEVNSHRGSITALSGDSTLFATSDSLRRLTSAAVPSGSLNSLSDLGIGYDKDGNLYLDNDAFTAATSGKLDQVQTFLGTVDGSGLLKNLSGIMDNVTKADSGFLSSAISTTLSASKAEGKHIADQQDRVDNMHGDLLNRMAIADAAIALMEQQVSYLNGMWAAMKSAQDSMN